MAKMMMLIGEQDTEKDEKEETRWKRKENINEESKKKAKLKD